MQHGATGQCPETTPHLSLSEEVEYLQMAADESQAELREALEKIKTLERELKLTRKDNDRLRQKSRSVATDHLDEQDILASYASEEGAKEMLMSLPSDKRWMMATKVGQQRWSEMTWLQRLTCVQTGRVTPPPPAPYVAYVPESATVVRVPCRQAGFALLQEDEEGQQTVVVSQHTSGAVVHQSYPVTSVHAPPQSVSTTAVQEPAIVPGKKRTWSSRDNEGREVVFNSGEVSRVIRTEYSINSQGDDNSVMILDSRHPGGARRIAKLKNQNKTWAFQNGGLALWCISWTPQAVHLAQTEHSIYSSVNKGCVFARTPHQARVLLQEFCSGFSNEENELDCHGKFWLNADLSQVAKVCDTSETVPRVLVGDKSGEW